MLVVCFKLIFKRKKTLEDLLADMVPNQKPNCLFLDTYNK